MGPTFVQINHSHLLHNYSLIRDAVKPAMVMAVVKANAYGHGNIEISQTLVQNNVDYLGVAFHEEAISLRQAGIETPILVFGAQLIKYFDQFLDYNLDLTITQIEQLSALEKICQAKKKKAKIHLKIDTGMNRVGFYPDSFKQAFEKAANSKWIVIVGVYSHLSSADESDPAYTEMQIDRFTEIKNYIQEKYSTKILFHLANSAAIMNFPSAHFDMVRPGVMLYGNPPSPGFKTDWDLQEVMRFRSEVALIKDVEKNEPVSYNRRFYTPEKTKVAVIPVGYADGYNRKLTNIGKVIINGEKYPVIGTVCMDQILVHLGHASKVKIGDEAVLFGKQGNNHISISDISKQLNTIPYEVTCWPSSRVARIHLNMKNP
ncbi:MAG: alanine racemase [Calditrichaeota bacterium]|nr:MAG: alanine racemase [Calditrichota bacterium]MBL1207608.1 alanine racemase [Calditrichota bacterium]NOG47441.1 alanine racemase [Calditrichota bacterium]